MFFHFDIVFIVESFVCFISSSLVCFTHGSVLFTVKEVHFYGAALLQVFQFYGLAGRCLFTSLTA